MVIRFVVSKYTTNSLVTFLFRQIIFSLKHCFAFASTSTGRWINCCFFWGCWSAGKTPQYYLLIYSTGFYTVLKSFTTAVSRLLPDLPMRYPRGSQHELRLETHNRMGRRLNSYLANRISEIPPEPSCPVTSQCYSTVGIWQNQGLRSGLLTQALTPLTIPPFVYQTSTNKELPGKQSQGYFR